VAAIGGSDRLASISTVAEQGEHSGNLSGFGQPFAPPTMATDHGTFEFYFKAPNLRSYVLHRQHQVLVMRGCDGKTAWFIDAYGAAHESKPKPGSL
jgi:hypothetical protein